MAITISAQEVAKLRKMTGAGMMDCKRALEEANGNYDDAIAIIRKKGQLVASKRSDRETTEGCVIAKVSADASKGVVAVLSCETDFVAKGADFIKFTQDIADAALQNNATNLDAVKALTVNGLTVAEGIDGKIAVIGEKIEFSFFDKLEAKEVIAYIHPGNKLACLVGFNKTLADKQTGKDVAMQVAAMSPVAVDKESVPANVVKKELEIALDQTKNDPKNAGKPADLLERIANGKLEKFYKEQTLLNQEFIKDGKITVRDYLKGADKDLAVTQFVRFALAQ
ncbi:MAG: translation elongation factor Ts [Bacteroidales bacterium]|jgi:elongation factor Ts|nr:translation elongation factor Ts [Bacteroidales bacterium]